MLNYFHCAVSLHKNHVYAIKINNRAYAGMNKVGGKKTITHVQVSELFFDKQFF